jgi:hypothetical protein
MMEVVPIARLVGYCRGGYSRHTVNSARNRPFHQKHNSTKAKYLCPKCGTIFYARIKRPHCPVDDYGLTTKAPLHATVNYSTVVE